MKKNKPMTQQQAIFVKSYADPASKTYGNGAASAKLAGYKNPAIAASTMLKKDHLKAALAKTREDRVTNEEVTLQFVKDEYVTLYKTAKEKGDIKSAINCLHDMTKMLGGFIDVTKATVVSEFKNISPDRITELEIAAKAISIAISSKSS